jgi:DNA replication protein DnaC
LLYTAHHGELLKLGIDIGQTSVTTYMGYRAIQNGFETLCTTAAKLIEDLSNASAKGQLRASLLTYTRPHVLLCDEIGYLSYGPDAANVLFHVVNERHLRKRPMIFTTNKPLTQWGKVLHDDALAAAILDRILERGRFVHLGGPSGRTRHYQCELHLPCPIAAHRSPRQNTTVCMADRHHFWVAHGVPGFVFALHR